MTSLGRRDSPRTCRRSATYAERFPTKVRLSGMAVGTQFGFAIGGFAPLVAAALAGGGNTAGWLLPAGYAALNLNDIGTADHKTGS